MSIACQKQYSLTVNSGGPDLYWKFEDSGPWVDSIASVSLPVVGGVVNSVGNGIIGKGIQMPGGGSRIDNVSFTANYTAPNSLSLSVWVNPIGFTPY